jgi:Zn-dependent protease with chaperone function
MKDDASTPQTVVLQGLQPEEYEHPLDRQALNALEGTPGLETLIRKINQYGIEAILRIQYTGSNIKVTSRMFPDIYEMLLSICRIIHLKKIPDLYIKQGSEINAFAIGSENPIIVLNEGTIGMLTPAELAFVMGHEVGHIKSQHMVYQDLARQIFPFVGDIIGKATLGIGDLFTTPIQIALLAWQRKSEFTCDRAGLLACQNINAATTAFMKIAGVPQSYYNNIDPVIFIDQAREFEGYDDNNLSKVAKLVSVLSQTHPWTVMRGAELYAWINSGSYQKLLMKYSNQGLCKHVFCKQCGKQIRNNAKFCPFCGSEV